jgi:hypothetical protein
VLSGLIPRNANITEFNEHAFNIWAIFRIKKTTPRVRRRLPYTQEGWVVTGFGCIEVVTGFDNNKLLSEEKEQCGGRKLRRHDGGLVPHEHHPRIHDRMREVGVRRVVFVAVKPIRGE